MHLPYRICQPLAGLCATSCLCGKTWNAKSIFFVGSADEVLFCPLISSKHAAALQPYETFRLKPDEVTENVLWRSRGFSHLRFSILTAMILILGDGRRYRGTHGRVGVGRISIPTIYQRVWLAERDWKEEASRRCMKWIRHVIMSSRMKPSCTEDMLALCYR